MGFWSDFFGTDDGICSDDYSEDSNADSGTVDYGQK